MIQIILPTLLFLTNVRERYGNVREENYALFAHVKM